MKLSNLQSFIEYQMMPSKRACPWLTQHCTTPFRGTSTNTSYQSHRQVKVKWKIEGNVCDDRRALHTPVVCCGLLNHTESVAVTWGVNGFYILGVWGQYLSLSMQKDFCRHGFQLPFCSLIFLTGVVNLPQPCECSELNRWKQSVESYGFNCAIRIKNCYW